MRYRSFCLANIFLHHLIQTSCCTSAAAGNRVICQFTPTSSTSLSNCCDVSRADCLPTHAWLSSVDQTNTCLWNQTSGSAGATSLEIWRETSGLKRQTTSYTIDWRRSSPTTSSKPGRGCYCFQTSPRQCDQCLVNWRWTGFTAARSGTRRSGHILSRASAADICDSRRRRIFDLEGKSSPHTSSVQGWCHTSGGKTWGWNGGERQRWLAVNKVRIQM